MNTANENYRPIESPEAAQAVARAAANDFNRDEYEKLGKPENVPMLLRMMENVELTPQQVAHVLKSRYQIASRFVSLLERAIQMRQAEGFMDSDSLYHALYRNFLDETAGGYGCEPPHEQGRRDALEALGVSYDAWNKEAQESPALSSQHLLREYEQLMSEGSLAAGAALLYYEGRIHRQGQGDYYRLLRGLERAFPHLKKDRYCQGDALYHIASHASHDEIHERELVEGVVSAVTNETDAETVLHVLTKAQLLWNAYWELLCEEVLGKSVQQERMEVLGRAKDILSAL